MGKPQDLTGMDFGYWHVEKKLPSIKKTYISGRVQTVAQYLCKCKCGSERVLSTSNVKHSNSCGCYRAEQSKKNREIDLIDKTFGELRVIKFLGKITDKPDNYWLCKCSCGNYTKVQTSSLISGNTKSCGCKKRFRPVKLLKVGDKYNRLTIVGVHKKDSYANTTYYCKCDCGSEIIARHKNLITGKVKSCGCLLSEKAKENIKSCCEIKDITGERFGKLIAIKPTGNRRGSCIEWECLCDCGRTTYVSSGNLRSDGFGTISCGCAESRGNIAVENYLKKKKYNYKMEYTFKDLRGLNNGLLRFDACVFEKDNSIKALIEFDGVFHFEQQYSSDSYECILEHDRRKNEYCELHNYKLIRIPYWNKDILTDILDCELKVD